MPAVSAENVQGFRLSDVRIRNAEIGVRLINTPLVAERVSFENVGQPWDIVGSPADVSGTRISRDPKIATARGDRVGWTPVAGAAMPAHCPECSSVFRSRNYKVRGSRFWSRDNEEVCPVCGNEHAKVADGLYDLTEEAVRIVRDIASAGAVDVLERIQVISLQIAEEQIPPAQSLALAAEASPALATTFQKALKWGRAAFVVLGFAASIAALAYAKKSYDLQASDRSESILEAIHEALNRLVVLESLEQQADDNRMKDGAGGEADGHAAGEGDFPELSGKRAPKGDRLVDRKSQE